MSFFNKYFNRSFSTSILVRAVLSVALASFVHYRLEEFVPYLQLVETAPISGPLYGTCAPIEHLQDLNKEILPKLKEIVKMPYFSTYKINMEKECPFWA